MFVKKAVSRNFCFSFFSWLIFPQAPENNNKVILNVFKKSQRQSQVKVHHRYQRHWRQILPPVPAGVADTSDELAANISDNFKITRNGPNGMGTQELGEHYSWKKPKVENLVALSL
jgi:hypothetical protein